MNVLSGEIKYCASSSADREEPLRKKFWLLGVTKQNKEKMKMMEKERNNWNWYAIFGYRFSKFCEMQKRVYFVIAAM